MEAILFQHSSKTSHAPRPASKQAGWPVATANHLLTSRPPPPPPAWACCSTSKQTHTSSQSKQSDLYHSYISTTTGKCQLCPSHGFLEVGVPKYSALNKSANHVCSGHRTCGGPMATCKQTPRISERRNPKKKTSVLQTRGPFRCLVSFWLSNHPRRNFEFETPVSRPTPPCGPHGPPWRGASCARPPGRWAEDCINGRCRGKRANPQIPEKGLCSKGGSGGVDRWEKSLLRQPNASG